MQDPTSLPPPTAANAAAKQHLHLPSPLTPTFPSHTLPYSSAEHASSGPSDKLDPRAASDQAAGQAAAGPSGTSSAAAAGTSTQNALAAAIVAFDPDNAGSADDDDDDDEDSGSTKKKRKTRGKGGGRAGGKAGASAGTPEGGGAGGSGSGQEDKEPRRKIEIGYIEKKEKRHITFSKRKAGIMKKVSADRIHGCATPELMLFVYCRRTSWRL